MDKGSPVLQAVHHVALICSDYEKSKHFYVTILGLHIIAEHYRAARSSWKLDLALPNGTQLELFSFPNPPARPSQPEACGLRHLAFVVRDLDAFVAWLETNDIAVEPIRIDEYTLKRFTFFRIPTVCRWNFMSCLNKTVGRINFFQQYICMREDCAEKMVAC